MTPTPINRLHVARRRDINPPAIEPYWPDCLIVAASVGQMHEPMVTTPAQLAEDIEAGYYAGKSDGFLRGLFLAAGITVTILTAWGAVWVIAARGM